MCEPKEQSSHPFSIDDFLEPELETAQGLTEEQLQRSIQRFQAVFGIDPPKDYMTLLRYYNGCVEDDTYFLAGIQQEGSPAFWDLFSCNLQRKLYKEVANNAILLGILDDTQYLYLPDKKHYMACTSQGLEVELANIWEVLEDLNFLD